MGKIIGWYCKDCGAGTSFYSGSGMLSFTTPTSFCARRMDLAALL